MNILIYSNVISVLSDTVELLHSTMVTFTGHSFYNSAHSLDDGINHLIDPYICDQRDNSVV